jgi:hypothetical protein
MRKLLTLLPFMLACGADPVSYSAPVGINLKAKSGSVSGTAITDDKAITTESGNPYGAFVTAASATLKRAPARIEVDHLTLLLGAQSTGVTKLDEVFTGEVDVAFVMNDTNNTYDVGKLTSPTGTGPVDVGVTLSSVDLAMQDFAKYLAGSFKVVIRGTAAAGFAGKSADANLQLTFTFAAFE